MTRFFFFLLGFGLTIIGSIYIIIYLNLTTMGYNFWQYVNFIIRRIECLNFIFGIIIMALSLYKEDKNELYIRYFSKF
jgi:hypothetical protein